MGIIQLQLRRLSMNDEITNDMGRIRPQSGGAQSLGYLSSDRPRSKKRNYGRNSSSKTPLVVLGVVAALILGCLAGLGTGYWLWGYEKPYTVDLKSIQAPDWIEQKFIRKNIFSRPDVTMKRVNNIVIPAPAQRPTACTLTALPTRIPRNQAAPPAATSS